MAQQAAFPAQQDEEQQQKPLVPKPKQPETLREWLVSPEFVLAVNLVVWGAVLAAALYWRYASQPPSVLYGPLEAVPCNPSGRPMAVCAHRGNGAELVPPGGGGGGEGGLLEHMSVLWRAGVTCFDVDVVQLAGGDLLVGHPAFLGRMAGGLAPAALHARTLAELRAAGIDELRAPLLPDVVRHFAALRSGGRGGGGGHVPVAEAAMRRTGWQSVPVLSLELKAPAANALEPWQELVAEVRAAGVADSVLCLLRHQPEAGAPAGQALRPVIELAAGIRRAAGKGGAGGEGGEGGEGGVGGLLTGLIVPDRLLLRQPVHTAVARAQRSSDRAAAAALLAAAGGLGSSGGLGSGADGSDAGAAGGDAAADLAGASAVLDAFDVLAPSVKLPPSIWARLSAWKATFAWPVEEAPHLFRRAMWLGADMAVSEEPVRQRADAAAAQASLCGDADASVATAGGGNGSEGSG